MAFSPPGRVTAQMTAAMQDEVFTPGQVIYHEGEPAARLYFIVDGSVELTRPGAETWRLDENSMIGILDAALDRPYSRTAVARVPTSTIVLHFADYLDILEDNFDYARRMLQFGSRRHDDLALELAPDGVFLERAPEAVKVSAGSCHQLNTLERLLALRSTRFFMRAPVQAIASLAKLVEQRHFEPEETLFQLGDAADELHILIRGTARVERDIPTVVADFHPIRVVAGLAAFGHDHHQYRAVAKSRVDTLVLRKDDLFDVAEDQFELARSLFAHIAVERERTMQARQSRRSMSRFAELPIPD